MHCTGIEFDSIFSYDLMKTIHTDHSAFITLKTLHRDNICTLRIKRKLNYIMYLQLPSHMHVLLSLLCLNIPFRHVFTCTMSRMTEAVFSCFAQCVPYLDPYYSFLSIPCWWKHYGENVLLHWKILKSDTLLIRYILVFMNHYTCSCSAEFQLLYRLMHNFMKFMSFFYSVQNIGKKTVCHNEDVHVYIIQ